MSACKTCGKTIIWLKTAHGKNIPVDAKEGVEETHTFDPKQHTSHFATCPQANAHRKPRGEKKGTK